MENQITCPKCHSTQLTANKKGFSGKKAVVGGLLTGGIGFLAGTIGSNKIVLTCLNCGNQFGPPNTQPIPKKEQPKPTIAGAVLFCVVLAAIIYLFRGCF